MDHDPTASYLGIDLEVQERDLERRLDECRARELKHLPRHAIMPQVYVTADNNGRCRPREQRPRDLFQVFEIIPVDQARLRNFLSTRDHRIVREPYRGFVSPIFGPASPVRAGLIAPASTRDAEAGYSQLPFDDFTCGRDQPNVVRCDSPNHRLQSVYPFEAIVIAG